MNREDPDETAQIYRQILGFAACIWHKGTFLILWLKQAKSLKHGHMYVESNGPDQPLHVCNLIRALPFRSKKKYSRIYWWTQIRVLYRWPSLSQALITQSNVYFKVHKSNILIAIFIYFYLKLLLSQTNDSGSLEFEIMRVNCIYIKKLQVNTSLISLWKHMLWVLIRSASVRHF